MWGGMKKADQFLAYLLQEEGLTLQQADEIAFGEAKPSPLLKLVFKRAQFEWKSGTLLLLLAYRYRSVTALKRFLGYSRTYPLLNKDSLRNLLLKWADKFFLQKNYCIFCDEYVELPKGDEHWERYLHLLLHHFQFLQNTPKKK